MLALLGFCKCLVFVLAAVPEKEGNSQGGQGHHTKSSPVQLLKNKHQLSIHPSIIQQSDKDRNPLSQNVATSKDIIITTNNFGHLPVTKIVYNK